MGKDDTNTCNPVPEPDGQKSSADARFRFCLSDDKMKLGISRYIPPAQHGAAASVEGLCRQVQEAGVRFEPDMAAAKRIIAIIRDGGSTADISGITLVRGIKVQEPADAAIKPLGNLEFPVFPGDRIAEYLPPREARQGETIDGTITKPSSTKKPTAIKPEPGDNCDYDATSSGFISQVYGIASIDDARVNVAAGMRISTDEIKVTGNLYPKDFRGKAVTPERIVQALRHMNVSLEPDGEWLDKELRRVTNTGEPAFGLTLVSGKKPKHGQDGWLEYLVNTREDAGTEDDFGRIDYRNRGQYPAVESGQAIARLHPPTKGRAGLDVFGKTVPAEEGRPMTLHAGENVTVDEEGHTYTATGNGIMVVERGTLSVTECLIIAGDVDMSTGNIHTEEGSVQIRGNVLSGFKVDTPKHIVINGTVESADIRADGNVEIKGGILQADGGSVIAGGDVSTGFAANSRIRAGKGFFVKNECSNCTVHAPLIVAGSGKGVIQGGSLTIKEGMEVNELGSELGVPTVVTVDIDRKEDAEILEKRAKDKQELKKIDEALGSTDPKEILMRTPEAKRPQMAKVLKHRMALAQRYEDSAAQATHIIRRRQEEMAAVKIRVKKRIHAGVTVKMAGKSLTIKRPVDRSMIYWHPGKNEIEIGNL